MLVSSALGASCAAPPESSAQPGLTDALVMRAVLVEVLSRTGGSGGQLWVLDRDSARVPDLSLTRKRPHELARSACTLFDNDDGWRFLPSGADRASIRALAEAPRRGASDAGFAAAARQASAGLERIELWSGEFSHARWRDSDRPLVVMTAPAIAGSGWALLVVDFWSPPRGASSSLMLIGWDPAAEAFVVRAEALLALS